MGTERWPRLELALRLPLALTLAYAGWGKVQTAAEFAEQVANYQWLPESAFAVAIVLPPTELLVACGLCVLPARWRQAAALLSALLFSVFTVAVTRALWLDINVDCGCFGAGSGEIGPLTVLRNVSLTGAALTLVWLSGKAAAMAEPQAESES